MCKAGDVIALKDSSRSSDKFKAVLEANSAKPVPQWLEMNLETLEGKVVTMPTREDVDLPIEEHYIVELYSK